MNTCIDQEACTGCSLCTRLCSAVFQMENGKAIVTRANVSAEFEYSCLQAANACPTKAIYIGNVSRFVHFSADIMPSPLQRCFGYG